MLPPLEAEAPVPLLELPDVEMPPLDDVFPPKLPPDEVELLELELLPPELLPPLEAVDPVPLLEPLDDIPPSLDGVFPPEELPPLITVEPEPLLDPPDDKPPPLNEVLPLELLPLDEVELPEKLPPVDVLLLAEFELLDDPEPVPPDVDVTVGNPVEGGVGKGGMLVEPDEAAAVIFAVALA